MTKQPKTRKLTDDEIRARMQQGCPACGSSLIDRHPCRIDRETGRSKPTGFFLGCSQYGKTCFADYSLSLDGREKIV